LHYHLNMPANQADVFTDADGHPRIVRGVCCYTGNAKLAEMAAMVGFETVWLEMEHGPAGFELIETLCTSVQAGGAAPSVRVSDSQRHHVLRALEAGARIVIVPMVNSAEQAAEIVRHGKFPPIGARGYNTRSRGIEYGLHPLAGAFAAANARTYLFAQIETMQAVENLAAICAVRGLAGIFIGPGDLSVSLGCPGDMSNAKLIETATGCIRNARSRGLHAGILASPGALLDATIGAGADLIFAGGDLTQLASAWPKLLATLPRAAS
jgi:4-hydroxy-2-oxoheptanedioate aldolase